MPQILEAQSSKQPGTSGPAPSEIEGNSLSPSQGAPPPYLENRSIWPDPDRGTLLSERGVPPAHPEQEVVLPNYSVPGHTTPWDHGGHVEGVEDDNGSNMGGKWVTHLGAKIPFLKSWFCRES